MLRRKVKFLALVCHSLGELDVLFPFFARLKSEHKVEVTIIIAVKSIYEQYLVSDYLQYCTEALNINVRYLQLPNKFDFRNDKSSRKRLHRFVYHLYVRGIGVLRAPLLFPLLISADIYMHEISNQQLTTRILYRFRDIFRKPILSYHHGAGAVMSVKVDRSVPDAESVLQLSFHEHNRETLLKLGFIRQLVIGYPQFYPEWQQLVSEFSERKTENTRQDSYILILSRHVHPYYMDEENYIYLLTTSCMVIRRKFGNIQIRIKPHPRENTELIHKILSKCNLDNFVITWEHPSVLAAHARATITFWGSSILQSLAVGTPTVEYYIEAKRFRELEFEGSSYKKLGMHSIDNEDQLSEFFDGLLNGTYEKAGVLNDLATKHKIPIQNLLQR